VRDLRRWLAGFEPPDRGVVRGPAHRELARRAAAAAVTLVRDEGALLPLRPVTGDRIVVITPQPRDLTPADSSSDEPLALAAAVRRHHDEVTDVRVTADPSAAEIAGAREAAAGARYAIVASLAADAQPGQARLVDAILSSGTPTVTLAMRTPYDLAAYPGAGTHLCSFAIVPASVGAVADVLFGRLPVRGRLPVAIPGLYPRGHGREVDAWD
jgi:beta-N-acetylhexosaminidase